MLIRVYGFRASAVYRFGRLLSHLSRTPAVVLAAPLWPFYWLAAAFHRYGYGIHLALSAEIGPGLYIGHLGGICLAHCRLGAQCSIGQQTKIGSLQEGPGPSIGDRVWIGAHSKIQGQITIGDGATIGAGARVVADVPARTLVMGDPARTIGRDYDNTTLLML
jgi:serine O-acetyltransferase